MMRKSDPVVKAKFYDCKFYRLSNVSFGSTVSPIRFRRSTDDGISITLWRIGKQRFTTINAYYERKDYTIVEF
jgi:hypothetical protein